MPGVNPALLANLSGGHGGAGAPQMPPPAPGAPSPGGAAEEDKPESVALHDDCMVLQETLASAMQMATDLQSQAQLADDMDPAVEKALAQVADSIKQASDTIAKAEQSLGDARKEHDEKMGGPGDADADDMPPA